MTILEWDGIVYCYISRTATPKERREWEAESKQAKWEGRIRTWRIYDA